MKYLKTFEENDDVVYNTFMKFQYCHKCGERTNHIDGKCQKCKKIKDQKKSRKKNWGVK